jgi:hypothetical protein
MGQYLKILSESEKLKFTLTLPNNNPKISLFKIMVRGSWVVP